MLTLYIVGTVVFSIIGVIAVNIWIDERGDDYDKGMRGMYSMLSCATALMWPLVVPWALLAGVGLLCYRWIRTRLDSVRID